MSTRISPPGFTIVEILIAIAIIGILSAFGVPLGGKILANSRLNTGAAALRSSLTLARSRAMANPQVHCGLFLNPGKGFLLFNDVNGNGQYDSSGANADVIYQPLSTLPKSIDFDSIPAAWNKVILFRGDGSARLGGAFLLKSTSTNRKKRVVVSKESGEVRITQ